MTDSKQHKTGKFPAAVRNAIDAAATAYAAAAAQTMQALRDIGAVISEGRQTITITTSDETREAQQFSEWGFTSDAAFVDAVKQRAAKAIGEGASATNLKQFVSLGASRYALEQYAPEVVKRSDFNREVLKRIAPVVNAVTAGKVEASDITDVVDAADALLADGTETSLSNAIVHARNDSEHAADERVPSWYSDLQTAARKLIGSLHLVKRSKTEQSVPIGAFEQALEYLSDVTLQTDPTLFHVDAIGSTEGWTVDRVKALRAMSTSVAAMVDNIEYSYRQSDDNTAKPLTLSEIRSK